MDDNVLVTRYLDGDDTALTELVKRYQRGLYGFVYRHVGNHADAADVTQKVFVNLFLKADQFSAKSTFKTWLYQIAINQCKNHYRSNDRQRISPDVELEDLTLVSEDAGIEDLENQEERSKLRIAVEKLPTKQRMTVQLRLYQECSFAEIAAIMSGSVGTAKAHYFQAITSLRKMLKEENYEIHDL
jgi:RNA polymerase sigma-70 factor (ECF subfamily)